MFEGKKVVITGATAGIGRAMAIHFAQLGASVAIFGTNPQRASDVLQEIEALKKEERQLFSAHTLDVADHVAVGTAIDTLMETWKGVDVLINNAGIVRDQLLMKMDFEDWRRVIDVNLTSVYNFCHALVRPMLKARRGTIINIGSVIGLMGNAGQTNYAASKAGMMGFTKSLAREVASRGIRVNCIAPGFIDTQMTDALTEEQRKVILDKVPLGRMGRVEEIAHVAAFLASDHSSYITGQVITVDGGMVM